MLGIHGNKASRSFWPIKRHMEMCWCRLTTRLLMDLVLAGGSGTNGKRKNLASWARTRNIGSSKLDLFGTILSIRESKAPRGFQPTKTDMEMCKCAGAV